MTIPVPSPRHLGSEATPREATSRAVLAYLHALAGREPPDALFELRYRAPSGSMRQRFVPLSGAREAADAIVVLADSADVFVGCAPRTKRFGGKDAIERVWTLWADCDGIDASSRLASFAPAPAVVIRSGSGKNRHAYWPLAEPLEPRAAELANRRLAHALGADSAATDAARILRPPCTRNHKRKPPAPVAVETLRAGVRFAVDDVVGSLAYPPQPEPPPQPQAPRAAPTGDPLRSLPPDIYVVALTGRRLRRNRKIACPLHEERTPSLHVYPAPDQGWYCFGCGRGGSVYDLAAALWRLEPRGEEFLELHRRLCALLLPGT